MDQHSTGGRLVSSMVLGFLRHWAVYCLTSENIRGSLRFSVTGASGLLLTFPLTP